MSLLDVLAWLAAQFRPTFNVVTVPPQEAPDAGLLAYAPLLTTAVAAVGVYIASRALKASQESAQHSRRSADNSAKSADNSAASVEKADAALRGSVRPVLTVKAFDGKALVVYNAGPDVALDVHIEAASAITHGSWASGHHPYEDPGRIAVLPTQQAYELPIARYDRQRPEHEAVLVLLTCRDVQGDRHWTCQMTTTGRPSKVPTSVGTGAYTQPVEHIHDRYAQLVAPILEKRNRPWPGDPKSADDDRPQDDSA